MPDHFDYPETLNVLLNWTREIHNTVNRLKHEYTALKLAADTGEGDPNGLILTPAQTAVIEADMAVIELQVNDLCSAHNVEQVELPG